MIDIASALDEKIHGFIRYGRGGFDELCMDVFRYQFDRCAPYRTLCESVGRPPEEVNHWSEIPPVPTDGFKQFDLTCEPVTRARAVFESSGTSRGQARLSRHYVFNLDLCRAATMGHYRSMVLPDHPRLPAKILFPPHDELPRSSLAFMFGVIAQESAPGTRHFVHEGELHSTELAHDLSGAAEPVSLLGTSLSFVHFLEYCDRENLRFRLPASSRLVDTGGFKGARREVEPAQLHRRYEEVFGIPQHFCINEYGMCEMSSQFYDDTLSVYVERRIPTRLKIGPPWVRTQVVNPETLRPVEIGEVGLLQHVDLANRGSAMCLLTQDLGRRHEEGFELLGRVLGAEPRGCSILMDEMLGGRP